MQSPTTSTSLPIPLLTRLAEAAGSYAGEGINHADEKFTGSFSLITHLDRALIEITFKAIEMEPADAANPESARAFHEERTWITEDLLASRLAMWTVSTNTPGVLNLKLVEDTTDGSYSTRAVFRLGDPADMTRFREEISLSIRHDKAIEYVYSWAVPHEKFAVRSRVLLRPI